MRVFEEIGPDLFAVCGRMHGYLLRRGSRALCVDPGPGPWVERLDEIGVKQVDWILATHHHRDTLAHAGTLVRRGARLAAPAAEIDLIAGAGRFWEQARTLRLYDCDSDFFSLREPVPVEKALADGEVFEWAGLSIRALELKGHTAGSMAYVVEDESLRRPAFVGDNLAAPGQVHDLQEFHYDYGGFTQGTGSLRERISKLRARRPGLLLPAHGLPIPEPDGALDLLERNLDRHIAAFTPNRLGRESDEIRQVGPHVFFAGQTTYVLIADSGRALIWDFGYVNQDRLERLRKEFGLKEVSVVTFSHYHDDHICRGAEPAHLFTGAEHPRSAQIWCHRLLYDVLTRPLAWRLPCIWPQPIPIDRVYGDETIEWEGIPLDFFEFPGQTCYHVGMVARVDGRRYAFTGDNIWRPADKTRPMRGPIIPRNRYFVENGLEQSIQKLIDRDVDFLCTAHTDAFPVTRADLEEMRDWAREAGQAIRTLCPDEPLGYDPLWCRFDPFHIFLDRSAPAAFRVVIESPFRKAVRIAVRPACDSRVKLEPPQRILEVPARGVASAEFELRAAGELPAGHRIPVTAGLTIDGVEWGEIGEGLAIGRPTC